MAIYWKTGNGIDGQATQKEHEKWFDVEAYSTGCQRSVNTGSASGSFSKGQSHPDPISITKVLDSGSAQIQQQMSQGKAFPEMLIHVTQQYENEHRVVIEHKLTDAFISGFNYGTSKDDGQPHESYTVLYQTIATKYVDYDKKGKESGKKEYIYDFDKGE